MDLGCADMGFLSETKHTSTASPESAYKEHGSGGSMSATMKDGKNKALKEAGQITVNALNKFTSQIKKPHRKHSPINWFPRKKVDSYLKRKIKMLQDLGGMNTSLDETLGEANPHYTRVEKEKMAAREAARNAMEARKAAMIEASWCRILQAARIQNKEAEALLLKAEKNVAEAFQAAAAMGVVMYDIPNCPKRPRDIEAPSNHGGESTAAHTVAASFETAFEVDKEVAAAVKTAFIKLASCSSISKDEFRDLLQKISQTPELSDGDLSDFSSECESDNGSEVSLVGLQESEIRQRKCRKTGDFNSCNKRKLVDMMLERLKCLQEEELASLATIVATCGLSAALAEVEHVKHLDQGSLADVNSGMQHKLVHRMSSLGGKPIKLSEMELESQMRNEQVDSQLPSLDKFLVKHVSKLEKEVLEAKKTRMNESIKAAPTTNGEDSDNFNDVVNPLKAVTLSESVPDLGSILVKHSSKLEKAVRKAKASQNSGSYCQTERRNSVGAPFFDPVPDLGSILLPKHSSKFEKDIGGSKRKWGNSLELNSKNSGRMRNGRKLEALEVPSLDKCLVKHISRLEREVLEAKRIENNSIRGRPGAKENIVMNYNVATQTENAGTNNNMTVKSLDEILVKPVHRLPKERMQSSYSSSSQYSDQDNRRKLGGGNNGTSIDSLEKVLVKHVSRLEREKLRCSNEESAPVKRSDRRRMQVDDFNEGGLDQVLVKHKSRLEGEKVRCRTTEEEAVKLHKSDRSEPVETNEGGLDQILVKHESGLEREKIAAAQQPEVQINYYAARREARERELQDAWGGLSLGNSVRPYLSKLEREKAAWVKAEEEQRRLGA